SKRGAFVSSWTETKRFTTYPPRVFACGDPQEVQQPLNTTPLISAIRGEVFTVGDFNMRLTKVTGGDGVFSGYGSVETPFLGVNLAVKFDNIRVNELYQVVDGEVIALSDGIDGLIETWEGDGDAGSDDGDNTGDDFDGVDIDFNGEISDVTVGDDGVIVVTDEDGTQTAYPVETDEETGETKSVKVVDSSGDTWIVDSDGITKEGSGEGDFTNTDTPINNEQLKKLFIEVLNEFKNEIDIYLLNNGKGPLDELIIRSMMELPDCLPKHVDKLEEALAIIEEFKNNPYALLDSVLQDTSNIEFIESQMASLVGPEPYKQHFTSEEWKTFKQMVCAYLKRIEEERITYEGFVATVQGDTVNTDEIYIINASQVEFKLAYWSKNNDVRDISYKVSLIDEDGATEESYVTTYDDKVVKNVPWTLVLEPVREGKYTIIHKLGEENEVKQEFWVRHKHYDFACKVCGRDLKITHERLKKLFSKSGTVKRNPNISDYFKLAVEKAELNTCYRQAHFFSQIDHESSGMRATVEGSTYSLARMLSVWKYNSNAKTVFYKQSFWDDEDYLDYASKGLYEKLDDEEDKATKYKPSSDETFKWNGSDSYKITIKTGFSKDSEGEYKQHSLTSTQQSSNGKKLLNLVYSNGVGYGNGDVDSGDGYKYRGRGAIQLTGKGNYKAISDKCNALFGTDYDWESNPDEVKTSLKATVLSASAFIIKRLGAISKLDTECTDENDYEGCVKPITHLVNGGYNGLGDRKEKFKEMIEGMFNNCKAKKK
ncbi:hypothetical protein JMN32_03615, partial [Fulvivirga sp. 29W222]